jgi:monoamine oxidase
MAGTHGCDVVVLGAGVAGLRAAAALARARLDVCVLEARDRIGGRVHTERIAGHPPLERGAEFVHGRPRALRALLRACGATTDEADGVHLARLRAGRTLGDATDALAEAMDALTKIDVHPEVTVARVVPELTHAGPLRDLALEFVAGFYAADPATASAQVIGAMARAEDAQHGEEMRRVREGYDVVVDALAAALPPGAVHLSSPALEVHWRRDHVRVIGVRETVTARACVVALPLGVLRHGDVSFTPRLDHERDWQRLVMGDVVKVLLRLRADVPWRKRAFAFLHAPELLVPTFWRIVPDAHASDGAQTLVGWAGGPKATALSRAGTAATLDHALGSLETLLGIKDVARFLDAAHVVDWRKERWTRGAYAVVPSGAEDAPHKVAQPIADTLFFAGEHTQFPFMGTVHGALSSGDRVASEVRGALGVGERAIAARVARVFRAFTRMRGVDQA